MKLKRRLQLPRMGEITIHKKVSEKAKEHHRKLQQHVRNALPADGEAFGKSIEKNISASNKVWRNVGVAFFGQKSLENISHFSSYLLGILMLIAVDVIMIFPTDTKSLAIGALVNNFFVVLAGLIVVNLIAYAGMRLIGSNTSFKVFFSTVNTALFMSLLVVSIPIALVTFALFSTMLKSESVINMFFSLIPFYNYLVFGWASESIAKLKGIRSILVALIALLLILFLNLLTPQFMV